MSKISILIEKKYSADTLKYAKRKAENRIMNCLKATKGSRTAPGSELTLEPITHLGGCWCWAGGWGEIMSHWGLPKLKLYSFSYLQPCLPPAPPDAVKLCPLSYRIVGRAIHVSLYLFIHGHGKHPHLDCNVTITLQGTAPHPFPLTCFYFRTFKCSLDLM